MAKKKTSTGSNNPKLTAHAKNADKPKAKAKAKEPVCVTPPEPTKQIHEDTFIAKPSDKIPVGQGTIVYNTLKSSKSGMTQARLVDAIRKQGGYPLQKHIALETSVHYHLLKFQKLELVEVRAS